MRPYLLPLIAALAGCAESAARTPTADLGAADVAAPLADVSLADVPTVDRPTLDTPAPDRPAVDAPDAPAPDVGAPEDRPAGDVGADVSVADVPVDAGCTGPTEAVCGGACVDLRYDTRHCGRCGSACPAGRPCIGGSCTGCGGCAAGTTCCGPICTNTQTDRSNCGACGLACPAAEVCVAGACRPVEPPPPAPCTSLGDYQLADVVRFGDALGSAYSPRCVTVRAGAPLAWEGSFSAHPLTPSTRGASPNPIPATASGGRLSVTFPSAGFFPFYCGSHGTNEGAGMAGVVRVIP